MTSQHEHPKARLEILAQRRLSMSDKIKELGIGRRLASQHYLGGVATLLSHKPVENIETETEDVFYFVSRAQAGDHTLAQATAIADLNPAVANLIELSAGLMVTKPEYQATDAHVFYLNRLQKLEYGMSSHGAPVGISLAGMFERIPRLDLPMHSYPEAQDDYYVLVSDTNDLREEFEDLLGDGCVIEPPIEQSLSAFPPMV